MTDDPKDAERLAAIREFVSPADTSTDRVFLLQQINARDATIADLKQERDAYKQVSLDCHDALGKCAVERDTATRRVEALGAEVGRLQIVVAAHDKIATAMPCPKCGKQWGLIGRCAAADCPSTEARLAAFRESVGQRLPKTRGASQGED